MSAGIKSSAFVLFGGFRNPTGANTSECGDEKRFLEMCFVRFFSSPDP